jgi:hypothetical protein
LALPAAGENYGKSWAINISVAPMLKKEDQNMKRRSTEDSWQALNCVTDAAERFVNHSPRLKRLEGDRQALLDAIRQAQLLLSVKRLPPGTSSGLHMQPFTHKRTQRAPHRAGSGRST